MRRAAHPALIWGFRVGGKPGRADGYRADSNRLCHRYIDPSASLTFATPSSAPYRTDEVCGKTRLAPQSIPFASGQVPRRAGRVSA
jgi:hypothetical protein